MYSGSVFEPAIMASKDGSNAQAFHPIFALVIPAKAAIQNNVETTGVSTYSLL